MKIERLWIVGIDLQLPSIRRRLPQFCSYRDSQGWHRVVRNVTLDVSSQIFDQRFRNVARGLLGVTLANVAESCSIERQVDVF